MTKPSDVIIHEPYRYNLFVTEERRPQIEYPDGLFLELERRFGGSYGYTKRALESIGKDEAIETSQEELSIKLGKDLFSALEGMWSQGRVPAVYIDIEERVEGFRHQFEVRGIIYEMKYDDFDLGWVLTMARQDFMHHSVDVPIPKQLGLEKDDRREVEQMIYEDEKVPGDEKFQEWVDRAKETLKMDFGSEILKEFLRYTMGSVEKPRIITPIVSMNTKFNDMLNYKHTAFIDVELSTYGWDKEGQMRRQEAELGYGEGPPASWDLG